MRALIILVIFVYGCSPNNRNALQMAQFTAEETEYIEQKQQLEQLMEEDLVETNANGEVTDIKGLETLSSFNGNEKASNQDLRENYANNEKMFDFDPPEGIDVEFSEPNMVTGASLFLTNDSAKACKALSYQEDEPSFKEIVDSASSQNICGSITLSFCIRMLPAEFRDVIRSSSDYIYTHTPSFSLDLPCKVDSFKDLAISIAGGEESTDESAAAIHIDANFTVSDIYITNSPNCEGGGQWEAITSERRQWGLEPSEGSAMVYAKFKDVYGAESECLSDSISYSGTGAGIASKQEQCFGSEASYIAENIVAGVSIGELEGTASPSVPVCSSDGQVGCITTESYRAAEAAKISEQLMADAQVDTLSGSLLEPADYCTVDGELGCGATSSFPAALATGLAAKVLSGNMVAGIPGTATEESRPNCSSDGDTGCISTATYRVADTSGLAAKIITGNTVAGETGTAIEQKADCSSDGATDCAATNTYKAALTTGLAAKVLSGHTVAGVSGTATEESRPNCSSDGEDGCISTATYRVALTTGLAPKVIAGNTVAGIAGTAIELHANCTGADQDDCLTTSTYRSMDLSAKDAGGAVDLTNSNFSTHVKTAATMEFWDEMGTRYTTSGDADITEANILDGTEVFGVTGAAGAAPDCSSITGSGTWILVPGDLNYGTNDFCVMKYEAKCSLADGSTCTASASSENPTSTAANTPWVDINQQDSKTECASLGKGYHLITNDEWMTIAANAAAQGANWDGGTVGVNEMARGHSDNKPNQACATDVSDANPYVEGSGSGNCSGLATGTFNQRRTHTLSNGEVIWDLAGNVYEWTSYFNDSDKHYDATDGAPADSWREYTLIDTFGSSMSQTDLISQAAIDGNWSSTQSLGRYWAGISGSGGALRRGGGYNNTSFAGLFTASMNRSPTYDEPGIGFRCAVAIP